MFTFLRQSNYLTSCTVTFTYKLLCFSLCCSSLNLVSAIFSEMAASNYLEMVILKPCLNPRNQYQASFFKLVTLHLYILKFLSIIWNVLEVGSINERITCSQVVLLFWKILRHSSNFVFFGLCVTVYGEWRHPFKRKYW